MNETPDSVIGFWVDEIGEEGWFRGGDDLDAMIRERFLPLWQKAATRQIERWRDCAWGTLAYLLVTDQFGRNIFRNQPEAFSTDVLALRAAKAGISQGFDRRIDVPLRHFFYMPLCHSESGSDQERGVRLILTRLPDDAKTLLHARAHREVIRRFGRFPHRNDVLGRTSTSAEAAFLEDGGYGALVRTMEAA